MTRTDQLAHIAPYLDDNTAPAHILIISLTILRSMTRTLG